jgi:Icc-related predicted phosphoesterase
MRIFAISDLHSDFAENWALLRDISGREYTDDVLIVAGDIAHRIDKIESTLALLRPKFERVFYLPGNHELWVKGEPVDSIQKFEEILKLCHRLDVLTSPARVGAYWIVPLFSWYDDSLDHDGSADASELNGWADFRFCRWPAEIGSVVDYMLEKNSSRIRQYDAPVISFSHFLPRRDLLPGQDRLIFKGLPRVAGSTGLDEQIRALGSQIHVFGHSHINWDKVIDGVRYVQNAILYPREREALTLIGRVFWETGNPLMQLATA